MSEAQTTARVEVIQADREAAANLIAGHENTWPPYYVNNVRSGTMYDETKFVQAFAAHRHHFAGSLPDGAEAMRAALAEYDEPMSALTSAERGERLADAIRALPLAAAPEPPERFASQEVERLREALAEIERTGNYRCSRIARTALADIPQPDAKEGGDA